MTTISSATPPFAGNRAESVNSPHHSSSSRGSSLGTILKTAGLLALALTGGAQARPLDSFSHTRNLNQGGEDYSPEPYGYKTLCKSGIIDHYAKGMSYENCLLEENTAINEIKDSKPLALLKRCYTGSGSLSAALTGVSLASLIGCTEPGAVMSAISISLAGVALLPTTICGGVYATINSRIRDSRGEADECCKHFPTQAIVQANAEKAATNTTATVGAPAASNISQALVPAAVSNSSQFAPDAAPLFNETAVIPPVASAMPAPLSNSTSTHQVKTLSNSTTIITVTTVTNTTVSHHPKP